MESFVDSCPRNFCSTKVTGVNTSATVTLGTCGAYSILPTLGVDQHTATLSQKLSHAVVGQLTRHMANAKLPGPQMLDEWRATAVHGTTGR